MTREQMLLGKVTDPSIGPGVKRQQRFNDYQLQEFLEENDLDSESVASYDSEVLSLDSNGLRKVPQENILDILKKKHTKKMKAAVISEIESSQEESDSFH